MGRNKTGPNTALGETPAYTGRGGEGSIGSNTLTASAEEVKNPAIKTALDATGKELGKPVARLSNDMSKSTTVQTSCLRLRASKHC